MSDKKVWLVVKVLDTNQKDFNYEVVHTLNLLKRTKVCIGKEVYFRKKRHGSYKATVLFISPDRSKADEHKTELDKMKQMYQTYITSTFRSNVYENKSDSNDSSTLVQNGNGDIDSDHEIVSDSDRSQQDTSCKCNKRFKRSDPTSHERVPILSSTPHQDRNADIFNLRFDVTSQTDPLPELSSADTIDELKSAMTSLMEKFNFFSVRILNIMNRVTLDNISEYKKLTELQEELARLRERCSDHDNTSSALLEQDMEQTPRLSSERGTDNSRPTSKDSTG